MTKSTLEHQMLPGYILAIVMAMLVAGCDQTANMDKFVPHEEDVLARGYIDSIRKHNLDPVEKALDASLKRPNTHAMFEQMSALMPDAEPISVKVVGAHINTTVGTGASTTTNLTYEFQYADRWLLANVALRKVGDVSTIVGIHVNPLSDSLENLNRFTLSGKGAQQYLILGAAIVASLFTLFALVLCATTKLKGRKWPWILFIIFGLGKFSVNWTTGQFDFMPIAIQFFSAGAFAGLYGPWVVSVSIPFGAALFLLRRTSIMQRAAAPDKAPSAAPAQVAAAEKEEG
jgi:hypothetical protein